MTAANKILPPELELALLRNQMSWWKHWAIYQTAMCVASGAKVHPNDKMLELTKIELEGRCETALLDSCENSQRTP